MGMRKIVSFSGIDPSLVFLRHLLLFCHELVSSEAALLVKVGEWGVVWRKFLHSKFSDLCLFSVHLRNEVS
jgi:hypothetical protein